MEIEYRVNGRKVSPSTLGDQLQKAILEEAGKQASGKGQGVRCNEHHQSPRVVVNSSTSREVRLSVEGCCDEVIEQVKKRLQ